MDASDPSPDVTRARLYHRLEGTGEPTIVLLNGGMMTVAHWEPVAARLVALGHRVLRLDLPGQLLSPGPAPDTLRGYADAVAGLLAELGLPPVVVAGTSFGTLVGIALAALHPERVAALVAMNATSRLSPSMVEGTRRLRRYAREVRAGGDAGRILDELVPATYSPRWIAANGALLPQRRAQMAGLPPLYYDGLDALLAALEHMDLTPYLAAIRAPTHVVAAADDATFPVPFSEELAAAIPHARLTVVPNAPHGFVIEQPEAAARIIHAAAAARA